MSPIVAALFASLLFIVVGISIYFLLNMWVSHKEAKKTVDNVSKIPPSTIVYVRQTKATVCHRWESPVHYDIWGTPYISSWEKDIGWRFPINLRPNGVTSDWVYGTEWKHKSGPEVTFGERKQEHVF